MVEGLSGLIKRDSYLNLFFGFKVRSSNLVISYFWYADDTLIIEEPSIENL